MALKTVCSGIISPSRAVNYRGRYRMTLGKYSGYESILKLYLRMRCSEKKKLFCQGDFMYLWRWIKSAFGVKYSIVKFNRLVFVWVYNSNIAKLIL